MRTLQLAVLTLIAGATVLGASVSGVGRGAPTPSPTWPVTAPTLVGRGTSSSRASTGDACALRATADPRDGLTSRLASRRVEALRQLVERGEDAAALRPDVERLAKDADPHTALWAKAALVRLGGPGGLRAELCRTALANPGWDDAEQALEAVTPEVAKALLAAGAEQRERARQGGSLAGLEAVIEGWTQSSQADPAELVRALSWSSGEDLFAWLRITRGLAPVPAAALRALAQRLADAPAQDAAAIAKFFSAGPDLSLADDEVERALVARAVASAPGSAGPWLLALGRLPRLSEEARRSLETLTKRSPEDAQDVAIALHPGVPR